MTRLFVLLYLGVLAVLFTAWYIHGAVSRRRAESDRARVIRQAHAGGARLVARQLDAAPAGQREPTLVHLRKRFDYPLDLLAVSELPRSLERQIAGGADVAYFGPEGKPCVVALLDSGAEVVRLGPFPDYDLLEIEQSIGGWMRLSAEQFDTCLPERRDALLGELRRQFEFPIDLVERHELPDWPRQRIAAGEDIAFYPQTDNRWFAATPLSEDQRVVRFGPFPSFEQIEQKAATTTLALVLLPAAIAIALLLRPVARQLQRVEHAAQAIAAGNLGARVDERRVRSARPLAQAFNHMAARTEALVRTQRELLQAVSHELRTPLSRMRFAIDLIETASDDQQRQRRLESLHAATEELDELLGELISYVRIETAEPQLEPESIAIRDTLEVLIPKFAALHPAVHFAVSPTAGSEGMIILADRTGFQRAIGNLLGNAGRHARREVTVNAARDRHFVTVDVDDDGAGIAEADRERVFEPFVRLDDAPQRPGVGLGLALVKRIVTQHGGSVEVLGSPLGGCRIRTTWPRSVPGPNHE